MAIKTMKSKQTTFLKRSCDELQFTDTSGSDLDSFLSEGVVMKDFSHLNVLGLVGVVFDTPDDTPHLVLPFMENGNLKNFLKSKREKLSKIDHLPEVRQP